MGIFYVNNPSRSSRNIFLSRVDASSDFGCRGHECPKSFQNCNHFFNATKIPMKQIEAIDDKFLADGSGWFNKASFIMVDLKPKYRKLLGDACGPKHA